MGSIPIRTMSELTPMKIGFVILGFFPLYVLPQDTIEDVIEQKLEHIAELTQNEETDYTTILEALSYYKTHPLNLNTATANELSDLGLLNELQIEALISHIEKNGKLISIYELQCIDGFDVETIRKILPYVFIRDVSDQPNITLKEMFSKGNHQLIFRIQQVIEKQKGFAPADSTAICNNPDSRYIGSPQKIYTRYHFNYGNNLSTGFTAEKDPGELFFKRNHKFNYPCYDSLLKGKKYGGFDFYSAHIFVRNIQFIKALAIGDYQIGFGQGLTAWNGPAYGKSSDAVNIRKNAPGLKPYISVDENQFMRGVALTGGSKTFQTTGFFSHKKIDANITLTDSLNEAEEVSSLQTTGLHTTPSEIADKHAITQTIYGGNISYRRRKFSAGITAIQTLLGAELNRNLSAYNKFEFTGNSLLNMSADYSFMLKNLCFFGEAAMSQNGGTAFLNGCIMAPDPKLSLAVLHRNFQKEYQSLHANAFAEGSMPANEQGIYLGISVKPVKSILLNAYYDHFAFPWLKYQVNAPSSGKDVVIQLNYTPNKKFDTYLRYRQKDKFVSSNTPDEIDFIVPFEQKNYRWHIAYQILPSIKLRNRVEWIMLNDESKAESETGYLVYQDVIYKKTESRISFAFRYALFDTKSYDSRIYAYETEIPGAYSIPSYYYMGNRVYLMLNYDVTRRIEFWIRCSQTYYSNKKIINEGSLNEIRGNTKSEIKLQLRFKF